MSSSSTPPAAASRTPLARRLACWLARRAGLDANPLRRPADRAQAWLRIIALVLLVAGVPLTAAGVGRAVYHRSQQQASRQAARQHRARAVLLTSAPIATADAGAFGSGDTWARARWQVPGGFRRTGVILVPAGTPAGSVTDVWLNSSGRISVGPLPGGEIAGRAISAGVLTAAAGAIAVLTALWLLQWRLDRRRLAAWDAAWARVEPRWTRHGPYSAP